MIKATQTVQGDEVQLELDGIIDEHFDLKPYLSPVPRKLNLNLKGVKRINSIGVKKWLKTFAELTNQGGAISLSECSPAVIEQLNFVQSFAPKGSLRSLQVPFRCSKCDVDVLQTHSVEDLRQKWQTLSQVRCPMTGC
jgi:anti-anti-sigma regulatory factor